MWTEKTIDVFFYKDQNNKWRWNARSIQNREIVASSSEGYSNRIDCVNNANLIFGVQFPDVKENSSYLVKRSVYVETSTAKVLQALTKAKSKTLFLPYKPE